MRVWIRRLIIPALVAAVVWTRLASNDRDVMRLLRADLAQQYHACIPLGWSPVLTNADGTYYPGRSVEVVEQGVWFPALWLARVRAAQRANPNVRTTVAVLDELVRIGMLQRSVGGGTSTYRLTLRAMPYFYANDEYGNNPSGQSYLCYSHIVPEHVTAYGSLLAGLRAHDPATFRATFSWEATSAPAWVREDDVLRRHSVLLAPLTSPAIATIAEHDGDRYITELSVPGLNLPHVVDVSAWPRPAVASRS